ncbi:unnamed protein product, partial [Pylaiella littoralis]
IWVHRPERKTRKTKLLAQHHTISETQSRRRGRNRSKPILNRSFVCAWWTWASLLGFRTEILFYLLFLRCVVEVLSMSIFTCSIFYVHDHVHAHVIRPACRCLKKAWCLNDRTIRRDTGKYAAAGGSDRWRDRSSFCCFRRRLSLVNFPSNICFAR